MSNTKALLAGVIGVVALFAIVVGAFTTTSKAQPAEAICTDFSCFMELLAPPTCEEPEGPVENTGVTGAIFYGDLCCEVTPVGVNGAFIDPCDPPCLEVSCVLAYMESLAPDPCAGPVGALLDSVCCEEEQNGEIDAALISLCCEEEEPNGTGAALIDPCNPPCLEASCLLGVLDSLTPPDPCDGPAAVLLGSLCCEENGEDPSATFVDPCACPGEGEGGISDVLSRLFTEGIRSLFGIQGPDCTVEEIPE